MGQYILALNQGLSESKATLIDNKGSVTAQAGSPLKPIYTKTGWAEYKPEDILKSQLNAINALFRKIGAKKKQIMAIGIANQPSTLVMWDKSTGKPVYNAIAYQDLRGNEICREWTDHRDTIRERTGLSLSPYCSASKIKWLLENVRSAQKYLEKGHLLCGTVNTYLLWHLTKGEVYATDHANAAKTLLCNIFTRSWDKELLELFAIPLDILPPILPTSHYFGDATIGGQKMPVHASIATHQASLLGNGGLQEGDININYSSDGGILINTGKKIFILPGLLTTVAWSNNGNTVYLLEGRMSSVGPLFEWMRDRLGIIGPKDDLNVICRRSSERIFMMPAIAGIGSPYWTANLATCIFGLKSTTTREDIIRSAVESIAFLVKDNFNIIEKDGRLQIKKIIASGDASGIPYLLQFQSDLLHMPLYQTGENEPVSLGVAFLAGLNTKVWQGISSIERLVNKRQKKSFNPKMKEADIRRVYERWRLTCICSKEWSKTLS